MHFLIILIAIAVLESNGQLAFIQRDIWVQKWHGALAKLSSSKLPALDNNPRLKVAVYVLVPAAVLQLVLWYLGSGILVFLLELAVLLYCLVAATSVRRLACCSQISSAMISRLRFMMRRSLILAIARFQRTTPQGYFANWRRHCPTDCLSAALWWCSGSFSSARLWL